MFNTFVEDHNIEKTSLNTIYIRTTVATTE